MNLSIEDLGQKEQCFRMLIEHNGTGMCACMVMMMLGALTECHHKNIMSSASDVHCVKVFDRVLRTQRNFPQKQ